MSQPSPPTARALGLAAAIAVIILAAAGFFYIVTTFLFAFSGGQARMVQVVNLGPVAMVMLGVVVAAVNWILRSPIEALKWTAIATGAGWVAAVIIEWLLSFRLGA